MTTLTSNEFSSTITGTTSTSILSTRTDVGFSDGNQTGAYNTINGGFYNSGTKHYFTDSTSIATINADSSIVSGDQVLFQAGGVWNIPSDISNKLKCKSGVLYGRYGVGANPQIKNSNAVSGGNFQGVIEVNNKSNVVIDGLDVTAGTADHFGIYAVDSDNVTVRRLTVGRQPTQEKWYNETFAIKGGGIIMGVGTTNCVVEFCEVAMVEGGPHESIAFTGTDGYTCRYNYSHHNDHAGINNKNFSKNGVIYGNEIHNIFNDPSLYVERGSNLVLRDNWVHDNEPPPGTGKVMIGVNLENYGSDSLQYNRNIDISMKATHTQPGFMARDGRPVPRQSDWTANVIENNIIWDTNGKHGQDYQTNLLPRFTNRYNLYETGTNGGADLGTNTIFTSTEPFVDRANNDYTPAGAAVGAGNDGSDVGATITWGENSWL